MKIHFCDLCNESVPDGDLSNGKAFMRKGRVVCAACESSMGGTEAEAKSASSTPASQLDLSPAPHAPKPSTSHATPAKSGGGGALVGTFALLLVIALTAYVGNQFEKLAEDREVNQSFVVSQLGQLGSDLDDFSRRARDRNLDLETSLHDSLAKGKAAASEELQALRAELAREVARSDELREQLATLNSELLSTDAASSKRIDDMMAQSMKSRDRFDVLEDRLRETEHAIARGAAPGPASVRTPVAVIPKYTAELADLASDNAGERWNAVQALGETGDPAVIAHLVPVLKDPDVFVRMAVARVLGDLAAPEAIEPLIDALEDEEAVVREAAMVALHGITGRNFRFDPVASTAERAKKIKSWRSWWKKASEEYFGEP